MGLCSSAFGGWDLDMLLARGYGCCDFMSQRFGWTVLGLMA